MTHIVSVHRHDVTIIIDMTHERVHHNDQEELDGENGNAVVVTKKKSPVAEECKSKKEHVNVVFIGHVGE